MSLLLAASLFAVQASAATTGPNYARAENWLCLPGRTDICTTPLRTTALNPNGYGSTGQSPVAKDASIDCFVVYPTVSRDGGMNSDLVPGDGEEKAAVTSQFARFSGPCRVFVPVYRQMTLAAVAAASAGGDCCSAESAVCSVSPARSSAPRCSGLCSGIAACSCRPCSVPFCEADSACDEAARFSSNCAAWGDV